MRSWVLGVSVALAACTQPAGQSSAPEFGTSAAPAAVLLIAGDIARCTSTGDEATAAVLDSLVSVFPDATVVPNGDLVYPDGTAANFANCYHPSWGRHKGRSRPSVGNHEYDASPTAQFYFDYWNGAGVLDGPAGPRAKGWYAWNPSASWHVVVLNTNSRFVGTRAGSPQGAWLAADLAANTRPCTLALWHHPRFYSQATGPLSALNGYTLYPWQQLVQAQADLTINGSQHMYERFAPQLPDGTPSPVGMRQIIVGTGGASGSPMMTAIRPNSEVWGNTRGVLKLELGEGYYRWEFVPVAGKTFTDSGTAPCHRAPPESQEPPPDTMPPAPPPDTAPPVDTTPPPPPPPTPPAISLTVKGEKRADGKVYNTLDWLGAQGDSLNVHRNGAFISRQLNDGHYTNSRTYSGPVTYTYRVCETQTSVCSNEASVVFP